MKRRIAVTGMGVVCCLGRTIEEFWAGLLEGRRGFDKVDLFDPAGCQGDLAGQVRDLDPSPGDREDRRRLSRTDRLCLAATREALARARLERGHPLEDFGLSFGTSTAGMHEAEDYCRIGAARGFGLAPPSLVLGVPTSAPSDVVARRFRLGGPRLSNMTACASSAASIGFAADIIRAGDAPGMIAGGGDGLCLMTYAGFNALRLVDPEPCRPFDRTRKGLTLGEGAGVVVLEDWDRAAARGARPLAEFLDYGASCDAHHMTAPHPDGRGARAAMEEALDRAGVSANQVDHVNAHGTGTPLNDASEARAIRAVLGDRADAIPISATKSVTGHLLGGAGSVEAVAAILSLIHQTAPPTAGWRTPDAESPLGVVAGRPLAARMEVAMSNSFGFGGTNCTLVFRRCE